MKNEIIIDVRERDEFSAEHIKNSINLPLSHLAEVAPGVLNQINRDQKIIVMCRSGNRAKLAKNQLLQMGYNDKIDLEIYEGGILAWKAKGLPTVQRRKARLPIMRQVQLTAGLLALLGSILGLTLSLNFVFLPLFVGAGLTLAGATGFCGMATLLSVMPWNKTAPQLQEELDHMKA